MNTCVSDKAFRLLMAEEALTEITALVRSVMEEELAKGDDMDDSLVSECVDFLIAAESERNDAFRLLIPLVSCEQLLGKIEKEKIRKLSRVAKLALYTAIIVSLLFTTNAVVAAISGYNFLETVATVLHQQLAEDEAAADEVPENAVQVVTQQAETTTVASETTVEPDTAAYEPAKSVKQVAVRQASPEITTTEGANDTVTTTQKVSEAVTEASCHVVRVVGEGPTKRWYTTDDTTLSTGGLALRLLYSDGTLSHTYYSTDAVIKTLPDFTQAGTHTAVLVIGGIYEYSYEITVIDATPDPPESRRLLRLEMKTPYTDGYLFFIGDTIADGGIGFYACYSDGSREYISYIDHTDEVTLEGLDLAEETVFAQKLTVTYRGVSSSADYTVRRKRTVYNAAFEWNTHPKTLYYKGEPLGYGVGVDTETVLPSLASFQALPASEKTMFGRTFNSEIYWSIEATFQYDYMETQLLPDELDFVGYNPEQEGYQRIDIYYRGTYILSYYVYVYGDSGLIPRTMPSDNLMVGDTATDYVCHAYYTATGNGTVGDSFYSTNGSFDTLTDTETLQPGDREVITMFPDGTEHRYVKYARLPLRAMRSNMNFSQSLIKVPLANVRELPSEIADYRWCFTLDDGRTVEVDPAPYFSGVTNVEGSPLSPHSEISSMFAFLDFDADRRWFDGGHRIDIFCYVYDEGYENAYALTAECSSSRYFGQYDLLRTEDTEFNYQRIMDYRVSAVNNEWELGSRQEVTITGVEYGTAGDYIATFTTEFYGETLTAQRPVRIVEKIYTPTLKIVSDPNVNKTFFPGETISLDGAAFALTDEEGNEMPVDADEVTYSVTRNGSGHRLNSDIKESWFKVSYSYLRSDGKYITGSKDYRLNFEVKNAQFYYDSDRHIIFGSWDATDGADFYQFSLNDKVYTTETNRIVIDQGVDAILQYKNLGMRCGVYRDGQKALGTLTYYRTSGFPLKAYEEPTTEPLTEPTTEPATEPTTEPATAPETVLPTPEEAQTLLQEWNADCFGTADGDNAKFDVTADGVVNAKDYAVLLRQAKKAED